MDHVPYGANLADRAVRCPLQIPSPWARQVLDACQGASSRRLPVRDRVLASRNSAGSLRPDEAGEAYDALPASPAAEGSSPEESLTPSDWASPAGSDSAAGGAASAGVVATSAVGASTAPLFAAAVVSGGETDAGVATGPSGRSGSVAEPPLTFR